MVTYQDKYFTNDDGLRQHYRDYPCESGEKAPVVLCMPGLTRNARDFDEIAAHLAGSCRVIVVEQRGRGQSDWDPHPERYRPATYVADMFTLIDKEQLADIVALGTSLGGLMAVMMQSMRPGTFVGAILNDIGPELDPRGLERIRRYVGKTAPPESWEAAVEQVADLNAGIYPDFTRQDWAWLARKLYCDRDGKPAADYDPAISRSLDADTAETGEAAPDLWPLFDAMTSIPVLVLRGELSDILSAQTLEAMARVHPELTAVTVPNKGHVPLMTEPECLRAIDALIDRVR